MPDRRCSLAGAAAILCTGWLEGRLYVLIQIAEFAIGKSIIDFHIIRIRANREEIAPFQHDLNP